MATLTALAASRTGRGTSAPALASGYHLAFAAGAVLGVASIAVCRDRAASISYGPDDRFGRHRSGPSSRVAQLIDVGLKAITATLEG